MIKLLSHVINWLFAIYFIYFIYKNMPKDYTKHKPFDKFPIFHLIFSQIIFY